LSLEKSITTRSFKDPMIEIFDEEEDIDLDNLEIAKKDSSIENSKLNLTE